MIKTQKVRFIQAVSFFFFILAAGWGLFALFFPLGLYHLKTYIQFKARGIQSVQWEATLHGYSLDQCSSSSSGQLSDVRGCSCVALIHGLGDEAMTWKNILLLSEQDWKKWGVTDQIKVFAFDLPGSGLSVAPSDPSEYQVRKVARKIQAVLSQNCSQWVVVGNSMGGWIASWLALDWPHGVSRLVLLSPAGIKSMRSLDTVSLLTRPTIESLKEFQRKAYANPSLVSDSVWKQVLAQAKESPIADMVQAQTSEDDLDGRLHDIKAPVMILWGKADQIIPLSLGMQFRDQLRGAIWREVSDCGHLPQKECPLVVIKSISDMIRFGAI